METIEIPIDWFHMSDTFVKYFDEICPPDPEESMTSSPCVSQTPVMQILTMKSTCVSLKGVRVTINVQRSDFSTEWLIAGRFKIEMMSFSQRKDFEKSFSIGVRRMVFNIYFDAERSPIDHLDFASLYGDITISVVSSPVIAVQKLSNDLSVLLSEDNSFFSDVQLRCDSLVIPAHKSILSVRSPVFAAMFRSDMIETQNGTVLIEDLEPIVFKAMLHYIYSGTVQDLNVSRAGELLYAADKYQLPILKLICCNYLEENISIDNVLDILDLGELHDPKLKDRAIDYICNLEQLSALKNKDQWKTLKAKHPLLAMKVYAVLSRYPKKIKNTVPLAHVTPWKTVKKRKRQKTEPYY